MCLGQLDAIAAFATRKALANNGGPPFFVDRAADVIPKHNRQLSSDDSLLPERRGKIIVVTWKVFPGTSPEQLGAPS